MNLRAAINQTELLISDGGMGTELQKLGLQLHTCADEWCLTHPERVAEVHRRYKDAGSRLITTNTFGANRFALEKHGLTDKQESIAREGAEIAREVIGDAGWVLGDVGPCGELLEPLGTASLSALRESLKVQIGGLLDGGADAILIETLTSMEEAAIALAVAREMQAPFVIVTCAFDPSRFGPRTMMGAKPEELARLAGDGGADMVGANCGRLTESTDFETLIEGLKTATTLPLIFQPNAGQPELINGEITYKCRPESLSERLAPVVKHLRIVGGCCGSTPAHIRAMHDRFVSASLQVS